MSRRTGNNYSGARWAFSRAQRPKAAEVGWPKIRFRNAGEHRYTVLVQWRPHTRLEEVGVVQRFGSLPSCQSWSALPVHSDDGWTRSRHSRSDAVADLVAPLLPERGRS